MRRTALESDAHSAAREMPDPVSHSQSDITGTQAGESARRSSIPKKSGHSLAIVSYTTTRRLRPSGDTRASSRSPQERSFLTNSAIALFDNRPTRSADATGTRCLTRPLQATEVRTTATMIALFTLLLLSLSNASRKLRDALARGVRKHDP